MRYFQVVAGIHKDGDGVYIKGDTVQSTQDLTKKFRNKFFEIPVPVVKPKASEKQKPKLHSSPVAKKKEKEVVDFPPSPAVGKDEAVVEEILVVDVDKEEEVVEEEANDTEKAKVDFTAFGKEITKKFSDAVPLECRVFVKDSKRVIVDVNNGDILASDLNTHDEVKTFLVDITAVEDDAELE